MMTELGRGEEKKVMTCRGGTGFEWDGEENKLQLQHVEVRYLGGHQVIISSRQFDM